MVARGAAVAADRQEARRLRQLPHLRRAACKSHISLCQQHHMGRQPRFRADVRGCGRAQWCRLKGSRTAGLATSRAASLSGRPAGKGGGSGSDVRVTAVPPTGTSPHQEPLSPSRPARGEQLLATSSAPRWQRMGACLQELHVGPFRFHGAPQACAQHIPQALEEMAGGGWAARSLTALHRLPARNRWALILASAPAGITAVQARQWQEQLWQQEPEAEA